MKERNILLQVLKGTVSQDGVCNLCTGLYSPTLPNRRMKSCILLQVMVRIILEEEFEEWHQGYIGNKNHIMRQISLKPYPLLPGVFPIRKITICATNDSHVASTLIMRNLGCQKRCGAS